MEKRIVNFFSEGVRMEGDLFLPDGLKAGERRPGIVLCHGFTGIRSVILADYAKVFVAAGFVALTFDYRGFGGSEGTKWRLIPLEQIDDIRNAISFFETLAEVDPERIGLWGTSFGGGHHHTPPRSIHASRRRSDRLASAMVNASCSTPESSANAPSFCAR
jgi:cephalosporin-C deacetylase-like acetyl esterase